MKKLITIMCACFFLMLGICGCGKMESKQELTTYKLDKINDLTIYVDELKDNFDYDTSDYQLMLNILENAIQHITDAEKRDEVNEIYNDAILAVNSIDKLYNYKFSVVNQIVNYLSENYNDNFYSWYASENLIDILKEVILQIINADNRDEVDKIYLEAVNQIDNIKPCIYSGRLLTLKEAYNEGYITYENLLDIAKAADSEYPQEISDEKVIYSIKKSFCELKKGEYPDKTVEDVHIISFFGNYNGLYVVQISNFNADYPDVSYDYVVDNVVIHISGPEPLVWCLS